MNFLIKYKILDTNNNLLKNGTIKVKNKVNQLDAKVKLEIYFKKKYPKMGKLIVESCIEDNLFSFLGDIFK
jgi:hypothetical protein